MKLACNYCPEAELLVREGRIDIDYFKFPALGFQVGLLHDADAFEAVTRQARALRPFLLHGLYPDMDRLIASSKTPGLSFHPGFYKKRWPGARKPIATAQSLQERYPRMDFISAENEPYTDPALVSKVVRRAGCSFLLDISHAYISSRRMGVGIWEYLDRLPLDRVNEIHINGWAEKDGRIMCHVKINEAGYEILEKLLARYTPKIITVEYGREDDPISCGCPVIRPGESSAAAMEEIVEQVERIKGIIS